MVSKTEEGRGVSECFCGHAHTGVHVSACMCVGVYEHMCLSVHVCVVCVCLQSAILCDVVQKDNVYENWNGKEGQRNPSL